MLVIRHDSPLRFSKKKKKRSRSHYLRHNARLIVANGENTSVFANDAHRVLLIATTIRRTDRSTWREWIFADRNHDPTSHAVERTLTELPRIVRAAIFRLARARRSRDSLSLSISLPRSPSVTPSSAHPLPVAPSSSPSRSFFPSILSHPTSLSVVLDGHVSPSLLRSLAIRS